MPHDHHDHSHDELSPSGHPYRQDNDEPLTYWQTMEIAMRELLIEKEITTAAEITARIEEMDRRSPADGAAVIARAWVDPEYKAHLLADGSAACKAMGFEPGVLRLIAVENTADVHNVVVCTLCSCYPRNLLGLPPDWYKTRAYRSRVVKEPRKVLAEFGLDLPDGMTVRVHDSTADMRYVVLPARPEGTEGMSEAELAQLITRDSMIGTGVPKTPT
ncbi:nitrile hydratase subunit alpha [Rhodobacterales bacterium HTCC2150]|nr:nitrile hydratase subunit alpha [Rhodobacterales bacterium HTCC2150] [Rhodobacteraceae bacterium HTCC2150]